MSLLLLTMMFIMIPRAQAAAERISQVLETEPEILDAKDIRHANGESGYIEFRNVMFRYHGAEEPAMCRTLAVCRSRSCSRYRFFCHCSNNFKRQGL
jgi:ABC-type multidrug transport system, ATPase and permease components